MVITQEIIFKLNDDLNLNDDSGKELKNLN